jgi:hypothetical protein
MVAGSGKGERYMNTSLAIPRFIIPNVQDFTFTETRYLSFLAASDHMLVV